MSELAENKLCESARDGDFDNVVIAAEVHDANVNCKDGAPLRFLIQADVANPARQSIARFLLEKGADPTLHGMEAVRFSIARGYDDVLKLILDNKPEIAQDPKVIMWAARCRKKPEVVFKQIDMLLSMGANPTSAFENGPNTLRGFVVKYLVENKADLRANNGVHAKHYFKMLNIPTFELLDAVDKKFHPLALSYISDTM